MNVTGFVFIIAPLPGDCSVAGPSPVPDNEIVEIPVFVAMVRIALCGPTAAGVNVTVMEQVPPSAKSGTPQLFD